MNMSTRIDVRKATTADVTTIEELSKEILEDLATKGKKHLFGGVDQNEIREAIVLPSVAFLAFCANELVGFLFLQKPSDEETQKYTNNFPWITPEKLMILNAGAVKPSRQGQGIIQKLQDEAKEYMKEQEKCYFAGTVHPENMASRKALVHIAGQLILGESYTHRMQDGRKLLRAPFLIKI